MCIIMMHGGVKILTTWLILILYHVAYAYCAKRETNSRALVQSEKETARLDPVYYAQMWYRTWTFPATMALGWIPAIALLFYCFAIPAIQGSQAIRTDDSEPVYNVPTIIDGHVESYGDPPHHNWFHKWG